MSPEIEDPDSTPEARDRRIAALEARLARPPAVGVKPAVAALVMACSAYLLFEQRLDIAYFFSSKTPINLGAEGGYEPARAESNRYAEFHGAPSSRGVYGMRGTDVFVVIGVRESPFLVKRAALPTEHWEPGKKPPAPDARSFTVRGRLLSRAAAVQLKDAFERHDAFGETRPEWILLEGERPGENLMTLLWMTGVGLLFVINGWALFRGLRHWLSGMGSSTEGDEAT